jgi:aminoglycoside phosphotransferase (APT) family kinase protein
MAREYRVITALGPTVVPVPVTYGLCEDEGVNGRPFYVMEFVEGHIVRDAETAERELDLPPDAEPASRWPTLWPLFMPSTSTLVGLGDFAKRQGYIERQLRRWYEQFRNSAVDGVDTTTIISSVHDRLAADIPPQVGTAIVHGDYRLDNTVLGSDGTVRAVLDWEICTLGDPLADLGLLMVYWTEAGDEAALLGVTPTTVAGFPRRAEIREALPGGVRSGPRPPRFLRRLRLLEAGLHPAGCLRPLRRRRHRRRPHQRRRVRHQHRTIGRDGAEHLEGS